MLKSRRTQLTVTSIAAVVALTLLAPSAQALDNGYVATGQNLPPLATAHSYSAGPAFASEIREYQASGQWAADQASVNARAMAFLNSWLRKECQHKTSCKPAIVFDIDDTLESSFNTLSQSDFNFVTSASNAAMANCTTPRIESTFTLYQYALKRGVTPFLITGRDESQRDVTVACLTQFGITGYEELIMRSPAQASITARAYKSAARGNIEKSGWKIALSIGDQVSDSTGGHTAGRFVLPNPMYFLP